MRVQTGWAWLQIFLREFVAAAFQGSLRIWKCSAQFLAAIAAWLGPQVSGEMVPEIRLIVLLAIALWVVACLGYALARALPIRAEFDGVTNESNERRGIPCRVRVKNVSGRNLAYCRVSLVKSVPALLNLPLQLRRIHGVESRELTPGEEQFFDVAKWAGPVGPHFEIPGDGRKSFDLDRGDYRITLRLSAPDSSPVEKDFILKPGPHGPVIEEAPAV